MSSPPIFVREPGLIASEMDGDVVTMSVERGEYFGIGGVGTRIWELLAEPVGVEQITCTLLDEFDVPRDVCEAEVRTFLDDLVRSGLVRAA